MKKLLFILLVVGIVVVSGCGRNITEQEAVSIATEYVALEFNLIVNPDEPLTISNVFFKDEQWHIQLTAGDDKATVILDKKGKVISFEKYKWI